MTSAFPPIVGLAEVEADAVVTVDCRWVLTDPDAGRKAFEAGHIPGAAYASLDADLSDMTIAGAGRHPLPRKESFAATLGRLGISNADTVVAYDDAGGAFASRLWWMLRWVGHGRVGVLDGGIDAWVRTGGPLETGPSRRKPTTFAVGRDSMPVVGRRDVARRGASTVLIDARASERFRGDLEPLDPVAGHIPGATNAPYGANLSDGRFLPPSMIGDRFGGLGVRDAASAIVYCGSGVTACHDILAMEAAGLGTAALYPGSWSEWSRAGGDVETGD